MDGMDATYEVKVGAFEGPMALLLHLIRRNEINIYDIPIALITRQYLETLDLMQSLNLAVAGEFLVMAATLIHIKSKMLLPTPAPDAEEDDPRRELVGRLLEYQQFKDAAERMEERERTWREVFRRAPAPPAPDAGETADALFVGDLTLYDLLEALKGVVARLPDRTVLEITEETLSVSDRMQFILEQMEARGQMLFDALFEDAVTRYRVIVTFWALLEIVRMGLIRALQVEQGGPIWLFRKAPAVVAGEVDDG